MDMQTILDLMNYSVVQIVLVACIGALLGEMKKEVDDEESAHLGKFIVSWLSSGFGGVMVGLLLQGTIAKDNLYIVLGSSGVAGYAGQKQSLGFALSILSKIAGKEEEKKEEEPKKNNDDSEDAVG